MLLLPDLWVVVSPVVFVLEYWSLWFHYFCTTRDTLLDNGCGDIINDLDCFSLAGLLNAIFAKTFDDISIIPTFVLTPLTYLGGVFYSLSLLPAFWQGVSKLNPIVYMISGFRYGF